MSYGLTPIQARAFDYIASFIRENGHSPSYREIMAGLGLKSSFAAHRIVHQLAERGRIRLIPARGRSIALVETAGAA